MDPLDLKPSDQKPDHFFNLTFSEMETCFQQKDKAGLLLKVATAFGPDQEALAILDVFNELISQTFPNWQTPPAKWPIQGLITFLLTHREKAKNAKLIDSIVAALHQAQNGLALREQILQRFMSTVDWGAVYFEPRDNEAYFDTPNHTSLTLNNFRERLVQERASIGSAFDSGDNTRIINVIVDSLVKPPHRQMSYFKNMTIRGVKTLLTKSLSLDFPFRHLLLGMYDFITRLQETNPQEYTDERQIYAEKNETK